jgi:hypothetical protein
MLYARLRDPFGASKGSHSFHFHRGLKLIKSLNVVLHLTSIHSLLTLGSMYMELHLVLDSCLEVLEFEKNVPNMLDLDLEFTIYGSSLNIIFYKKFRGWIPVSNLDLFSHDRFLSFWFLCV